MLLQADSFLGPTGLQRDLADLRRSRVGRHVSIEAFEEDRIVGRSPEGTVEVHPCVALEAADANEEAEEEDHIDELQPIRRREQPAPLLLAITGFNRAHELGRAVWRGRDGLEALGTRGELLARAHRPSEIAHARAQVALDRKPIPAAARSLGGIGCIGARTGGHRIPDAVIERDRTPTVHSGLRTIVIVSQLRPCEDSHEHEQNGAFCLESKEERDGDGTAVVAQLSLILEQREGLDMDGLAFALVLAVAIRDSNLDNPLEHR